VRGDGEQGGVGRGGVEDEGHHLGLWVTAGQGEDAGAVGLGPGMVGLDAALADPVAVVGEDGVGAVDLVAGGGEVLADRAELGAPVVAVSQEIGGLRLVAVGGGEGVLAQVGLEVCADRAGLDEADQAAGEVLVLGVSRLARWPAGGR
jgi:hypothetical protein